MFLCNCYMGAFGVIKEVKCKCLCNCYRDVFGVIRGFQFFFANLQVL
jgi:hypothetical protein